MPFICQLMLVQSAKSLHATFIQCQTSGCYSLAAILWVALQQWLLRQGKASKAGKHNKGEVGKVWLELKSCALQDLLIWQDAIISQDMLSSAAERRNISKVIQTCFLDAYVLSCLMAAQHIALGLESISMQCKAVNC